VASTKIFIRRIRQRIKQQKYTRKSTKTVIKFKLFTLLLKMPDMKLQVMKMTDQIARHENAGH